MRRLMKSFGYAFAGLRYAFRTQANLRIHLVISLIVIAIGLGVQLRPDRVGDTDRDDDDRAVGRVDEYRDRSHARSG